MTARMPHRVGIGLVVLAAVAGLVLPGAAVPAAASLLTADISTVAGTGVRGWAGDGGPAAQAQLDHPRSLATMPGGGFLFAEPYLHVVRRVWPDGSVTTVAGTGTAGFSGDGGPATSARLNFVHDAAPTPDGGFVIADTLNNRIRKVSPAGVITTIAGSGRRGFGGDGRAATVAKINNPRAVGAGADGTVLIADSNNHRIRSVSVTGIMSTVAGTGVQGFSGDGGPATSAMLNTPFDVVASAGGLLIADVSNQRIRFVSAGGTITTVAGNGLAGFGGDGGAATAAALNYPHGVGVADGGGFLVADTSNARVREVTPGGVIQSVAGTGEVGYSGDGGPAAAAKLSTPKSVALVTASSVLVADSDNAVVRLVADTGPPPPASPPVNTAPPAVTGAPEVGRTLTASQGTWSGTTPMDFAYQWQDCAASGCLDVVGAVGASYTLTPEDEGSSLRVAVTASNAAGSSSATSEATSVVTTPPPAPGYAEIVAADAPSAWFRLGEPAGSTSFTSSSGVTTATAVGTGVTAAAAGLVNGGDLAASFDGGSGQNGFADAPYDSALNSPVFTVEAWVKATAGSGTTRVPVSSRRHVAPGSGDTSVDTYGFALCAFRDDTWEFWLGRGVDRGFFRLKSARPVSLGATTHLVGTFDGSTARLYVDGVLTASANVRYVALDAGPFRLGAANTGDPVAAPAYQWKGTLDEVALYPRPLTGAEVTEHRTAGVG